MQDPAQSLESNRGETVGIKPPTATIPKASPTRHKSSAKPRRSPPRSPKKEAAKNRNHQTQLVGRLKQLRHVSRETAQAYVMKIDTTLAAIIRALEERVQSAENHPFKTSSVKRMLKLLKRIDPKPVKGRRKDLRRIEKAVEAMTQLMPKKQLHRRDPKTDWKSPKTR